MSPWKNPTLAPQLYTTVCRKQMKSHLKTVILSPVDTSIINMLYNRMMCLPVLPSQTCELEAGMKC